MNKSNKSKSVRQYICENCNRQWQDDIHEIKIKECPYCGSCGLESEIIRIKL